LQEFGKKVEVEEELKHLQKDNEQIMRKANNLEVSVQEGQNKTKDLNARSEDCQVKLGELKRELTQKDSEILYMEGEHAALTKKINEKVRILHAAKENNIQNNIEKKQLAIEVEQIRIENEDYITKFNRMQETNKEKISSQEKIVELIEKEMEARFKNLSAKILAKKIDSLWIKQKKLTFGKLHLFVYKSGRKAQAAISFSLCMERVFAQHKFWGLQVLRNNTLKWEKCREINEVLSQGLYQDRKVKEAYLNWRDQFDLNLQRDLRINTALDSIVNITSKMEAKLLKQKMSQWNKQAHFQKKSPCLP